ncbi:MAG: RNA polymerase sigma factor [Balneolaceae bacterium]
MQQAQSVSQFCESLVEDIQNGKHDVVNRTLKKILPNVETYLTVRFGASPEAAKECTQQAFLNVYEQILQDNIKNTRSIYAYIVRASRNEYIRQNRRHKKFIDENADVTDLWSHASQMERLVDKERQQILHECLEEMDDDARELICYFFEKPGVSSKDASQHFNSTSACLRTRKSRAMRELHLRVMNKEEIRMPSRFS